MRISMNNLKSVGQLINNILKVNFNDKVVANSLFAELAKEAKLNQFKQQDGGIV